MVANSLRRFQHRLALVAYFRHLFGVGDVHDPASVRRFYNQLKEQPEGYDAQGRSHVYNVLQGRARVVEHGVDPARLLAYDANVKRHTDALNRGRVEPVTLKYFQVLAALMTEHYLDRVFHDPGAFLADLNAFVAQENARRGSHAGFPTFAAGDLNKLAFWMATGSGKTLIMHLNYYQYLHYLEGHPERKPANVLLVTPNEGLSEQHIAEMDKSGIPCGRFSAVQNSVFGSIPDAVKVIEITKLVDEKSGGGESVPVDHLEGANLVFVDEGHKGAGSEAQAWMGRRAALATDGFTFEYSATFGQALGGAGDDVEREYGKAILFDYSYPRFYEDGYGKDYRILNLEHDLDPDLTHRYLLANLLTFYEQVRCYEAGAETLYGTYNVAPPLQVYVGHSVTAGKTRSQLSSEDRRSLSDVQELVLFLHRVLCNQDNWVPVAIDALLGGEAGLRDEDGRDLFAAAFETLRAASLDGAALYADMLRRVFHVSAPAGLHLVNLRSVEGEIGLRAGEADRFFGVINVGDDANFVRLVEQKTPEIVVEEEPFHGSLFQAINQQGSPINVLIGAKKFIEGWDSWRVSSMGLMNIGRGEGPQIIQLFGRGVRLLGKDRSLKRSSALQGDHPGVLPLLETLSIFGIRARYMAQFRDYLAEEGIDVDEYRPVRVPTRLNNDFRDRGLLVIRPQISASFEDQVRLALGWDDGCLPSIDLTPRTVVLISDGLTRERPVFAEWTRPQTLPAAALPLLDWDRLYRETWQFRVARGYRNLALDRRVLQRVLAEQHYRLYCPPAMLETRSFAGVERLEQIAAMILCSYVEQVYTRARRAWEQDQMAYRELDEEDDNLIEAYEARVKRSAAEFLQTLYEMCADPALYEREDGLPGRVHFDRHLYLPLLLEDQGDDPVVRYAPPGLNPGELDFVKQLRAYLQADEGRSLLQQHDRELYLLRNQARGRGVGFLIDDERFFPDFILWLRGSARQDIAFVDPHGLITGGNLDVNPKVQFYRTIKEYEQKLNQRAHRDDVALHSFLISQTPFSELRSQTGLTSYAEFHQRHVYFYDQDNYVDLLLRSILPGQVPHGASAVS